MRTSTPLPQYAPIQKYIDEAGIEGRVEMAEAIADFLVKGWDLISEPRPAVAPVTDLRTEYAARYIDFAPK